MQELIDSCLSGTGIAYGHEASSKLLPGRLIDDRYLISIDKETCIEKGILTKLAAVSEQGVSAKIEPWLKQHLPETDVLHFGFEGSANPAFKVYLEHCNAFMNGLKNNPYTQITVFEAIKWDSNNTALTSQYVCRPAQSEQALRKVISECFMDLNIDAERLTQAFLTTALTSLPAERLLILEVIEQSSERKSFDLNLYDLETKVADWSGLISLLWEHQGLTGSSLKLFLTTHGDKVLGHISAGVGRDNDVFFTLYYGVTERHG